MKNIISNVSIQKLTTRYSIGIRVDIITIMAIVTAIIILVVILKALHEFILRYNNSKKHHF
jgi:heme/copper-type cytochrome/quinol oxidase subunit 2